jgi:predicted protein tyrosine phosphatase
MIEVMNNLFVGTQQDFEGSVKGNAEWAVVQACKEPYHREALGYTGRSASLTHPEYLVALRENRLILNMIDADDPKFIAKEMIDSALSFIVEKMDTGGKVLVHCSQGRSRAPSIAMVYMSTIGKLPKNSFTAAEMQFKKIYRTYEPAIGVRQFFISNWADYMR